MNSDKQVVVAQNIASGTLLGLVKAFNADLFQDDSGVPYISLWRDGHLETWPLDSREFESVLGHLYYRQLGKPVSTNRLKDSINMLRGRARFEGEVRDVHLRVGSFGEKYYLDLCNDCWQVVEIGADGWRIVADPPIRFRRTSSTRPLPVPCSGQPLDALLHFVNIDPQDWPLVVVWLLECLRPETPFPLLEIGGLQGSAKSTTQSFLRRMIDPNKVDLRAAPRHLEDLEINAVNNWIVSLNNVSNLAGDKQDALCGMSTGGGFSRRTLYTNVEETVCEVKRPVVLNGIERLVTRQDLIDRTIHLELPEIFADRRLSETALNESFTSWHPWLLGALLDIFSAALRELPAVSLRNLPRMADYVILGEATSRALGWDLSFTGLYEARKLDAIREALDASPVAVALEKFMADKGAWDGTVGDLYDILSEITNHRSGWPLSPKGLKGKLKRDKPALESLGIFLTFPSQRTRDGYKVAIIKDVGFEDSQCALPAPAVVAHEQFMTGDSP